jgi:acyl-CoA dehydrogenase
MRDATAGAPFLEPHHMELRVAARELATSRLEAIEEEAEAGGDLHALSRRSVGMMAEAGLLRHVVPQAYGGAEDDLQIRSLVAVREGLAYGSGLADALYALQGLGSVPITIAGSDAQKETWLAKVASGEAIAGFAMTEPEVGSDAANLQTRAQRAGDGWRLNGTKTLISNAGLADYYALFARTDPDAGHRGITCFLVPADSEGLQAEALSPMAAHPLGTLHLRDVVVGADAVIGQEGRGYHLALATLDRMRSTVAAAACGFAWRALDEAVQRAGDRHQFGRPIGSFQGLRWMLADAATRLEAARLLTYRAGWAKDQGAERVTMESAQAKLFATEAAQHVADVAVQVHGGQGVLRGSVVERIYRDVRSLRIYEGTSEVLRDVVGNGVLKRNGE